MLLKQQKSLCLTRYLQNSRCDEIFPCEAGNAKPHCFSS